MKNLKRENGAITIVVLVSVLFMISFLISSYILIANKVKTQKDIIAETRNIYESKSTMEEIYNSYFNKGQIIPIYTVEQLLMIGEEHKNVNINGKYYNFNNDENNIYMLMNDLKFRASDYPDKLIDGYWTPVGERVKFIGKNHNIEVIYTDEEDDDYSVIYSESSNYGEPEYEVTVIAKLSDGTVANDAKILLNNEDTGLTGETKVKIKRRQQSYLSAYLSDDYTTPGTDVLIINPNKIKNVSLTIEELHVTLKISTVQENAQVSINGENKDTITTSKGSAVSYKVSCDGYNSREATIELDNSLTIEVELAPIDYVQFSETFYFTRCSDEDYSGLLNGGKATVSHYDLTGEDVSMGSFYIDEPDITKSIPSNAIISKVTLYFDYYQTRSNTTLYTNTIKTSIFTGNTEKMSQKESERTNKTVKQAKYELFNISRKDLEEGITVNLLNYIEGTLKITSSVENMYCVIEGEKPGI